MTDHSTKALVAADASGIARAAAVLRNGGLVGLPTETVYGLAADATNPLAVARIFAAKGRPTFNPLIVHVPDLAAARGFAVASPMAERLAAAFWPGPLTLVLPAQAGSPIAPLATCGLDTVAIRVPDHPVARAVLAAAGRPLAAPSANRSGHISATTAHHVAADLGGAVDVILDAGPSAYGVESTILDLSQPGSVTLLRAGAVTREQIAAVLGIAPAHPATDHDISPNAPGRLASHYAPNACVRLDATSVQPGEALLAFGRPVPETDGPVINLSERGDLLEAAAALFSALRTLDASSAKTIAVMPIPAHGLGEAIRDRLARAAAPR